MKSVLTGKTLKTIRSSLNVKQAQLSELSGVSINTIVQFEVGRRDMRVSTLEKLLQSLGAQITITAGDTVVKNH